MLYFAIVVMTCVLWLAAAWASYQAVKCVNIARGLARVDSSRPRFRLVDFMAMFLTLQIPLLLTTFAVRAAVVSPAILLSFGGLYTLVYIGIAWWGAAALSTIEVHSAWRRMIFIGLLQPLGIVLCLMGGMPLLLLPGMLLSSLGPSSKVVPDVGIAVNVLLAMLAYTLLAAGYAWACNWVRAGSQLLQPRSEPEAETPVPPASDHES